MGSLAGRIKVVASRIGLSVAAYKARIARGQHWCTGCKAWHKSSDFYADSSRSSGLQATCKAAGRVHNRKRKRCPLKTKARAYVRRAVAAGRLPKPNDVPCTDCGRAWRSGRLRHEYDHHRGYSRKFWLSVQPVCTPCHRAREITR